MSKVLSHTGRVKRKKKVSFSKFFIIASMLILVMVLDLNNPSAAAYNLLKNKPLPVKTIAPSYNASFASTLYLESGLAAYGLSKQVLELALKGFSQLRQTGKINTDSILTIIDFSRSSKEKRLWVIDLKVKELAFNSLVAHGRNSGQEFAKSFSNQPSSNKSSLGFYITRETYKGSNGYSLKLDGKEPGINNNAYSRAIVMHGADYVNESLVGNQGYIGRSLGCPALPRSLYVDIIDKIKNGNAIFIYYPDPLYLKKSSLLKG